MTDLGTCSRHTIADALAKLPTADGHHVARLFERGDLEVELYAPVGTDPQQPHNRDELYIIAKGSGQFVCGGERAPFGEGDLLFVPAGMVHRFEEFSEEFATWVIFFGPKGGHAAQPEKDGPGSAN